MREQQKRKFHIGDILSVYTGRLLSPSKPPVDGVYKILNFLHRDNLYTHQIPRACRDAKPWLRESLPWLEGITCEEVTPQNYRERLAYYAEQYGVEHELRPIPHAEELHRNPITEAEELAGRVIVVELPNE